MAVVTVLISERFCERLSGDELASALFLSATVVAMGEELWERGFRAAEKIGELTEAAFLSYRRYTMVLRGHHQNHCTKTGHKKELQSINDVNVCRNIERSDSENKKDIIESNFPNILYWSGFLIPI